MNKTSIQNVLCVINKAGYFQEDLTALQQNPCPSSERYFRKGVTEGFDYIRQTGQSLSIGFVLENGQVCWGEATGVTYSGRAGRETYFNPTQIKDDLQSVLSKSLVNIPIESFKQMMALIRSVILGETQFNHCHTPLLYGISQALLQVSAQLMKCSVLEVLCREWSLPLPTKVVPLHAQSGIDKWEGAEKMLAHQIDSLPHALVDDPYEQIGAQGEKLIEYAKWLTQKVERFTKPLGKKPTIHLDVHGGIGIVFRNDLLSITKFLIELEKACFPYPLRMESVLVLGHFNQQLAHMKELRSMLKSSGCKTKLVVDEWANSLNDIVTFAKHQAADMLQIKMPDLGGIDDTVEAVLACKKLGVETLLGGSCNETDISARISAQVALALQPDVVLAKPGMGVCEGIMIVHNEMNRTLETVRQGSPS